MPGLCCCTGFFLAAVSGDQSSCSAWASPCGDFSCCGAQALGAQASVLVPCRLWSTGLVAVAHRLSCSVACEIFLDQGLNPCLLHWQVDSQPPDHQGNPQIIFFKVDFSYISGAPDKLIGLNVQKTSLPCRVGGHSCHGSLGAHSSKPMTHPQESFLLATRRPNGWDAFSYFLHEESVIYSQMHV